MFPSNGEVFSNQQKNRPPAFTEGPDMLSFTHSDKSQELGHASSATAKRYSACSTRFRPFALAR